MSPDIKPCFENVAIDMVIFLCTLYNVSLQKNVF